MVVSLLAGIIRALRPDDYVCSTYRDHVHALSKGVPAREVSTHASAAATEKQQRSSDRCPKCQGRRSSSVCSLVGCLLPCGKLSLHLHPVETCMHPHLIAAACFFTGSVPMVHVQWYCTSIVSCDLSGSSAVYSLFLFTHVFMHVRR
jgi:hypothetical protein